MCCCFYCLLFLIFQSYLDISSVFFFFFKQKTAYEMRISDWSSDVCSSDLDHRHQLLLVIGGLGDIGGDDQQGLRRYRGLRVVALIESTTRDRHEDRKSVG